MKQRIALILAGLIVFTSTAVIAQNFTKADAQFIRNYTSMEDEFEEDQAKQMVRMLDKKNEALIKNEVNKKKALEIMQFIQKALDEAKDAAKEEEWNDAGAWAVIGMIWVQALDTRLGVATNEEYYQSVTGKK